MLARFGDDASNVDQLVAGLQRHRDAAGAAERGEPGKRVAHVQTCACVA
jgi:hypothetical protein